MYCFTCSVQCFCEVTSQTSYTRYNSDLCINRSTVLGCGLVCFICIAEFVVALFSGLLKEVHCWCKIYHNVIFCIYSTLLVHASGMSIFQEVLILSPSSSRFFVLTVCLWVRLSLRPHLSMWSRSGGICCTLPLHLLSKNLWMYSPVKMLSNLSVWLWLVTYSIYFFTEWLKGGRKYASIHFNYWTKSQGSASACTSVFWNCSLVVFWLYSGLSSVYHIIEGFLLPSFCNSPATLFVASLNHLKVPDSNPGPAKFVLKSFNATDAVLHSS